MKYIRDYPDLHIVLVFHLQKTKKEYKQETGDSRCICQNELDKNCFQHNMAYWGFKELTRRTASDKILKKLRNKEIKKLIYKEVNKEINIAKNSKHDGY